MTKHIKSVEEFNEVVNSNLLVLVDFFATWCGPCKMLSPIIDKVAESYTGASIVKVDVDEVPAVAGQFNVNTIPTLIFFKDGKEVQRHVGYVPETVIVSKLDSLK